VVTLSNYQVVHKLGYGQYSTVWLVEDMKRGRYASLKILTATASTPEVDVMCHIQRNGSASSGSEFILQLIDEFEHTGLNGVHRCIISDVLVLRYPQTSKSCILSIPLV